MGTIDPIPNAFSHSTSQNSGLPPLVPISESSDPDAIALRSALSVLQIQRLRSIKDVQTLNTQKELALADPEAFTKALADGKVRSSPQHDLLGLLEDEDPSVDDTDPDEATGVSNQESMEADPAFARIPRAQTVVRCPPINWAKYHVVGEALDSLHEQQKRNPGPGEVSKSETTRTTQTPHMVAAPYSPWRDKLPSNPAKSNMERDP